MALSFVNRAQGGATTSTNTVAAPATSHTSGNLLVVLFVSQATGVTSVTDTAGNTYTSAGTEYNSGANYYHIYYAQNITGNASNVVTVTFPTNRQYRAIVVYQISGAATSSVLNTRLNNNSTGTAIDSGSFTLAASEEIICALMTFNGSTTITGGTGFTLTNFAITGDANPYYADEYKIVTANTSASATLGASSGWVIVAASFKVAAGATVVKDLIMAGMIPFAR